MSWLSKTPSDCSTEINTETELKNTYVTSPSDLKFRYKSSVTFRLLQMETENIPVTTTCSDLPYLMYFIHSYTISVCTYLLTSKFTYNVLTLIFTLLYITTLLILS